uniref:Uncharacterized protein n=1 Tax=Anopheles atroparvus TaxID=41427 RepID=A0AAG5DEN9_ANOAO
MNNNSVKMSNPLAGGLSWWRWLNDERGV